MAPYPSFAAFMDEVVRPLGEARPGDLRLDGEVTGGNRTVVGSFDHAGRVWKVHADTHYEPLRIATRSLAANPKMDPFIVEHTRAPGAVSSCDRSCAGSTHRGTSTCTSTRPD